MTHYQSLFIAYGTAMAVWLFVAMVLPRLWRPSQLLLAQLWPRPEPVTFLHPWREIGWAVVAGIATLGIGQLYMNGWRLPTPGALAMVTESINQLLIFSPFLLLLVLRRQSPRTAWLPMDHIGWRLLVGLGLALVAIGAYSVVRDGETPFFGLLMGAYSPGNIPRAVQVLLEDMVIAIVFVRLQSAMGKRLPILLVALLFAAGHIPAMLSGGAGWHELGSLLLDASLAVGILAVLQRSADVWWFWCVHFAMDMMQFSGQ